MGREDITMTNTQQKCVGCLGSGQLSQAVQSYLKPAYQLLTIASIEDLTDSAAQCSMLLYCDDQWHFQLQHKVNEQCLRLGLPWLRAYCEFGTAIIGPCVDPAQAGCVACVELRRRSVLQDPTDFILIRQQDQKGERIREQ